MVQPIIPPTMRVLFVGRDPGDIEDKTGTPFDPSAPAGGLLRRTLRDVGIPAEWCGFMNTVACHTPKNRGPNAAEILACQPWRLNTKREAACNLHVFLGAEAIEAFANPEGYTQSRVKQGKGVYPLSEWHGKVLSTTPYGQITKVAAYHPSAALRNNEMRRAFVGDMKAVAALLGVGPPTPPITALTTMLPPREVDLAVDTETVSLTDRTMLGIGIAWRQDGEVYGRWFSGEELGIGIDVLRKHRGRLAFHNLKFDWDVLDRAGLRLPLRQLDDVMLKAFVLRRGQEIGSVGLKELALADLGYAWTTLADMGNDPSAIPDNELGQYCLYDCAATLHLNELYDRRLDE